MKDLLTRDAFMEALNDPQVEYQVQEKPAIQALTNVMKLPTGSPKPSTKDTEDAANYNNTFK